MPEQQVVYALGFFDGVHIGHRAILAAARRLAAETHQRSGVFTYENHPQTVLRGISPPLITTPAERKALFRACGMETILILPFTKEFADRSPEAFLDLLIERYHCGGLCSGRNFRFGAKAAGSAELLQSLCKQRGLACRIVSSLQEHGQTISSTKIRRLIENGEMEAAARWLERPFSLAGVIAHGDGRGAGLGIPTINSMLPPNSVLPKLGVYATLTLLEGQIYPSVTNVGLRPTFLKTAQPTVETHILSFRGEVYGRSARVFFCKYLRSEEKFPTPQALTAQIARDTGRALNFLESYDRSGIHDLSE
ncbi:riboflavin biosynthesis protein RibF [Acidaminobacterium chupaoyuni]